MTTWSCEAIQVAIRLHKKRPFDVVISRSVPFIAHEVASLMRGVTAIPWIANWNDPVGIRIETASGLRSRTVFGGWIEQAQRVLTKTVLQNTSWNTFPSERMRQFYSRHYGMFLLTKSCTIPHVALDSFAGTKPDETNIFSICHAGKMCADGRTPEVFLEGLARSVADIGMKDHCKFVAIGHQDKEFQRLVNKYELGSIVHSTGPLSYEEALHMTGECSILLIIEGTYNEGIFLPSKFIDYIQTGRPILALTPKNGTLKDVMSAHGGGSFADCESVVAVARAIRELYDNWKKGTLEQNFCSRGLYHLFSPQKVINHYKAVFNKIGVSVK